MASVANARPRRTAILGFGHVAEHGHLRAWLARDDFRLVAVAEPDPGRRAIAADLQPQAVLYDDAAALLAAERLDAVDVAAPPALHAPLVVAAARAGCHVLCEKPLATTLDDVCAMRDAARTAGVALCTVHNWKHSAHFTTLRRLLADGAIGRLRHIRLETIRAGRAVSVGGEWRGDARLAGGGILVDHGWHAFYLLLGLAGERPRQVQATIERRRDGGASVEDTATCRVDFPSLTGEIFLTWAGDARRTSWVAAGTAGSVTLTDDRGVIEHPGGARRELTFAGSLSEGSHHPDWFGAVIDDFAAEIDDPARRGRNLAEAECCALLTALAYESGRRGGRPLPVPASLPAPAAPAEATVA
jgi:predicted dehydrogenase